MPRCGTSDAMPSGPRTDAAPVLRASSDSNEARPPHAAYGAWTSSRRPPTSGRSRSATGPSGTRRLPVAPSSTYVRASGAWCSRISTLPAGGVRSASEVRCPSLPIPIISAPVEARATSTWSPSEPGGTTGRTFAARRPAARTPAARVVS